MPHLLARVEPVIDMGKPHLTPFQAGSITQFGLQCSGDPQIDRCLAETIRSLNKDDRIAVVVLTRTHVNPSQSEAVHAFPHRLLDEAIDFRDNRG